MQQFYKDLMVWAFGVVSFFVFVIFFGPYDLLYWNVVQSSLLVWLLVRISILTVKISKLEQSREIEGA